MVKETLAVVKTLVETYAKMSYILGNYHFLILSELSKLSFLNFNFFIFKIGIIISALLASLKE